MAYKYIKESLKMALTKKRNTPIDATQFIKDWNDGMTWPDMRKKYNAGCVKLKEMAKSLHLNNRQIGPLRAIDRDDYLQRTKKKLPLIIKDFIAGVSLLDIMKTHKISYVTFRQLTDKHKAARKENMKNSLRRRRRNDKEGRETKSCKPTSRVRRKRRKAH